MAKPNRLNVASPAPNAGKKDPKPIFIRPYQTMPTGGGKALEYNFNHAPARQQRKFEVVSAK